MINRKPSEETVQEYIYDTIGKGGKIKVTVLIDFVDRYYGVERNHVRAIMQNMLFDYKINLTNDRYLTVNKKENDE